MNAVAKAYAEAKGFTPLTIDYELPTEQWMLDNVLEDLASGNIPALLVQGSDGVQVWRKGTVKS
jgi:hypothetical protein